VLAVVFILLEPLSPSRRIFIGSHSLPPPSLVHRFGPSTTTVTTTSHRSHEIVVSLGPEGTLVTGMKTEPVTVKLTSEMHSVNLLLLCLDEMRRICFHACLLSLD
jgi:hypothetical protein